MAFKASTRSAGRLGRLVVSGGYSGFEEELEFFDSSEEFVDEYADDMPETIPEVLSRLSRQQKNDTVTATLSLRGTPRTKQVRSLGQVVSGLTVVPVLVRR